MYFWEKISKDLDKDPELTPEQIAQRYDIPTHAAKLALKFAKRMRRESK